MEPNFELFEEGQRNKHVKRLHVTLNKHGHFFLNARVLEVMGNPDGVALLFDPKLQVIGVAATTLDKSYSYELRKKDSFGAARLVYAKNFCRAYGIKPKETVAFTDAKVNKDGVLVLDLQKVAAVTRDK